MSKSLELPSQELLLELFSYDPETGLLTRRTAPSNINKIGEIAGNDNGLGYLSVWVTSAPGLRKQYRVHRLIWKMMTGDDPDWVDHIDGVRSNNRWANLRNAPGTVNRQNQRKQSNNKSGVTGVCWVESANRWVAHVRSNGVRVTRQCKSFEEAVRTRQELSKGLAFHHNHGSERPRYPHPQDGYDPREYRKNTKPKRRYRKSDNLPNPNDI